MAPLDTQTALVTGASSGIGRATVSALAARGANVVLAARRESRLRDVSETIESGHDVETLVVPTNVREESEITALVEETIDAFDRLDIVVNNAGIVADMMEPFEEMSTESYRAIMETNTDGVFLLTRETLPHLRESGGTLVFVGSFTGKYPTPYSPVYGASKAWVSHFANCVDAYVGDDGVAVSTVTPSETRTGLGGDDTGTPMADRYEAGEASEPEELAEAIAFVATQDTSTVSELDVFRPGRLSDTFG